MRSLYPEIEPYKTGFLKADAIHNLYWEESGNPQGNPVIFLHGGPGSGTNPSQRRFFDPKNYRIILMDQRGCGKSTPHASLEKNTTWDLVEDLEKLREHLKVDKWVVFGGSWGSSLGLAYAETHPERVKALILRGIFLCRKKDIDWFLGQGAEKLFTDAWEQFLAPVPEKERGGLLSFYYKALTSENAALREKAAVAWAGWEARIAKLQFDPEFFQEFIKSGHAESISRIECHFFKNNCFFETDNWLLENIEKIKEIPGVIVHGRYDVICPFENAWDLHKAWPKAKLEIIPVAGHSATEVGIADALIRAADKFSR